MQKFTTLLLLLSLCLSQTTFAQHHSSKRGYLGIHSNGVSKSKAKKIKVDNPYGSYVTRVLPGSAAEKLGLQPFDYVYAINEQATDDDNHLTSLLQAYQPGDEVKVKYVRQGKEYEGAAKLTQRVRTGHRWSDSSDEPLLGVKPSHDKLPNGQDGVRVNIINNSTAEEMAMEDGDIITAINDNVVYDWHDLSTAINILDKGGEMIKVVYVRDGQTYTNERPIKTKGNTYQHNTEDETEEVEEVLEEAQEAIADRNEALEELLEEKEPIEIADMEVTMDLVSEAEAASMKEERGIDMPIINNLQIDDLNIFPNPSMGVFNLSFDLVEEGDLAVRVFSGTGRLIYQNDLLPFSGSFNDTLDLSDNPAGTYYLMVAQGDRSITRRVVIAQP